MELKLRFDPALDYICKYISPPNLVYNVIVMNLCHLDLTKNGLKSGNLPFFVFYFKIFLTVKKH